MRVTLILGMFMWMFAIVACAQAQQTISSSSGREGEGGIPEFPDSAGGIERDAGDGDGGERDVDLYVTFEGPAAAKLEMGSSNQVLFCFGLEAKGAGLDVRLPYLRIRAYNGGKVVTNSLQGVVFENPSLWEDSVPVFGPGKVEVTDGGAVAVLSTFRSETILLPADSFHRFCVRADVVSRSLTPEDFYGYSYVVEMGSWYHDEVRVVSSSDGPPEFLPLEGIHAPYEIVGHPMKIVSPDRPTNDDFNGKLTISLHPDSPDLGTLLPGAKQVPLLRFILKAEGGGACVRGIDVRDHGTGLPSDFDLLSLVEMDTEKVLYPAKPQTSKMTFGWHEYGLMFCLGSGEGHVYEIQGDVAQNPAFGETHSLWIDDPANDIDRVKGFVQGPIIVGGTFTVTGP